MRRSAASAQAVQAAGEVVERDRVDEVDREAERDADRDRRDRQRVADRLRAPLAPREPGGQRHRRRRTKPDERSVITRSARAAATAECVTSSVAAPSLAPSRVDHVEHALGGLGVEVAGRLVEQQQRRLVDERARDRDALQLAARQHRGEVVAAAFEADRREHRPRARRRIGGLLQQQRQRDVLLDRQVRQHVERLEHEAHAVAPQQRARVVVERAQVAAVEADAAGGRRRRGRRRCSAASTCRRPTRPSPRRTRRAAS